MRRLRQRIEKILSDNRYVVQHDHELEWKNNAGITLLAATGFLLMSVLNVYQKSSVMLLSTVFCSVFLYLDYFLARKKQNLFLIHILLLPIIMGMFTYYVIIGGNNGFAALWLILVPAIAMLMANLPYGFLMSLYFLIFLLLTFIGPLHGLLRYDYDETFLLRFPFLYLISFCLATYMSVQNREYRYKLRKREEELQRLGATDTMTGLRNRNSYNEFSACFRPETARSLAALYLDLNGLHELNNLQGHKAGDCMIQTVAAECTACFGEDEVFRLGGDEFLVVCVDKDAREVESRARDLARRIGDDGYSISCGLEVRNSNISLDAVVKEADRKMLLNKKAYYSLHQNDRRAQTRQP